MTLTWKRITEVLFADTAWPRTVHYWVASTPGGHYYAIERGYAGYEGYTGYTTWYLPAGVGFWDKGEGHQIGYGAEARLADAKKVADEQEADIAAWRQAVRQTV